LVFISWSEMGAMVGMVTEVEVRVVVLLRDVVVVVVIVVVAVVVVFMGLLEVEETLALTIVVVRLA